MSLFPSRFCRGNDSIYCELGEEGQVEVQMRNQPETHNSHGPLRSNIGLNFGSNHDFYSIIAAKGKLVAQEHLLLRGWVFQKRDFLYFLPPAMYLLLPIACTAIVLIVTLLKVSLLARFVTFCHYFSLLSCSGELD